jgi:hypothetical protein
MAYQLSPNSEAGAKGLAASITIGNIESQRIATINNDLPQMVHRTYFLDNGSLLIDGPHNFKCIYVRSISFTYDSVTGDIRDDNILIDTWAARSGYIGADVHRIIERFIEHKGNPKWVNTDLNILIDEPYRQNVYPTFSELTFRNGDGRYVLLGRDPDPHVLREERNNECRR